MVWRGEDTAQTASFDSGQAAPQSSRPLVTVGVLAAAVAALYFLREIFIPIALAVLLSFMLGPAVTKLRRWGVGRITAKLTPMTMPLIRPSRMPEVFAQGVAWDQIICGRNENM